MLQDGVAGVCFLDTTPTIIRAIYEKPSKAFCKSDMDMARNKLLRPILGANMHDYLRLIIRLRDFGMVKIGNS